MLKRIQPLGFIQARLEVRLPPIGSHRLHDAVLLLGLVFPHSQLLNQVKGGLVCYLIGFVTLGRRREQKLLITNT